MLGSRVRSRMLDVCYECRLLIDMYRSSNPSYLLARLQIIRFFDVARILKVCFITFAVDLCRVAAHTSVHMRKYVVMSYRVIGDLCVSDRALCASERSASGY